jgi:hypothetical protein
MTAQPRMSVARPKAFATRSRTATSISRSVVSEASTLPVHRRARHQQGACLPGPGFFDCARRLGRFAGDPDGPDARTFHATELSAVFACWGGSGGN